MIKDTPLKTTKSDRLGFGKIARHLSSSFLQIDLSRGFVVGMEEAWGSRKSSLVNLALEELSQQKGAQRVVRFAHWLVGNRDELLDNFFRISSRSLWRPCQPPKGKRQKRYWGGNLC